MSGRRHAFARLAVAAVVGAALCVVGAREARADARDLVEAALHLKVLSFDRGRSMKRHSRVTIAVIYGDGNEAKQRAAAMVENFDYLGERRRVTVQDKPVRAVAVANGPDLEQSLLKADAAAVYVAPGLDSAVPEIARVAARMRLPTLCSSRSYVRRGLALAVVPKGSKLGILLHLGHARATGMSLDSGVVRLAEIMR